MKNFLLTGSIGGLVIGMPITAAVSILGNPEKSGKGLHGWQIFSYSNGAFQISHHRGVLGLIGIYFKSHDANAPVLPKVLNCEFPLTGSTTFEEFKAYLIQNNIPSKSDNRLRGATALSVGTGVIANFHKNCLSSLLISDD